MAEGKYSERFEEIFSLTRRLSDIFGADVIKKDYNINWRTAFTLVVINIAIGFTFYTVYVEAIVRGNYYSIIKSAAVLGTGIQGYTKLINALKQQGNFRFLYAEIKEMYVTYESKSPSYRKVLKNNITLVKKLLTTLCILIVIITAFVIVTPVMLFLINKKRYEVLPFQFPFLDFESDFGYYLTSIFHTNCVLFGGFGNFLVDTWLFMFAAHIPLMKNILKCKLTDLDKIIQAHPQDERKSSGPLRDIFKWHQKYNILCDTLRTTFFWVVFVQIGTEFVGIICTIVCIFLGIWPPAPAFALYLFSIIFSYCSLGNLVELSNDDVIEMIYDSCWYNLTVKEQKMVLIMLRDSQQASGMTIGGVAPLSLNTCLQLTKTIYTLSMMLKEFLN